MGMDEYSMALYVKQLLEDARAAAARRALAESHTPRVMPALRAAIQRLRGRSRARDAVRSAPAVRRAA